MKLRNADNYVIQKADSDDIIYINITVPYSPNIFGISPAVYQQQLNYPILYDAQSYFMTIISFSLPTYSIPFLIAPIQPDLAPYFNTNSGINAPMVQSFTLTYGAIMPPQTFVLYDPPSPTYPPSPPLTPENPYVQDVPFYFIYQYTQLLAMWNTALVTAFNTLNAAVPGGLPVGSLPPYFIYDGTLQRIALITQIANYNQALVNHIDIYTNIPMGPFVDGLPVTYINGALLNGSGRDILFNITDLGNNGYFPTSLAGVQQPVACCGTAAEFYIFEQQYNALINWNSFNQIQVESNLLPIKQEFVPTPLTNANVVGTSNAGTVSNVGILSTFIPLLVNGADYKGYIDFSATGPYRYINMYGALPISIVDFKFYWTTQNGNRILLNIPYNQSILIKLMFIKKSVVGQINK